MVELGQWVEVLNERDQLKYAIQRVRELHKPVDNYCDECSMYLVEDKYSVYIGYPCDTIKALDGEQ